MVGESRAAPMAPGLVLAAGVRLRDDLILGAHVMIEQGVAIGSGCTIQHHAVLGKAPVLGAYSRAPRPAEGATTILEVAARSPAAQR